jgi:hypothetical protein
VVALMCVTTLETSMLDVQCSVLDVRVETRGQHCQATRLAEKPGLRQPDETQLLYHPLR